MICLEGLDGCGKTTHSLLLEKCLKCNNIPCLYTREPGGSKLGEVIRNIVLYKSIGDLGDILLYTLNRHVHIKETILPNKHKGSIIILDRYLLSTLVYQGNSKELVENILLLHKNFNYNLFPKLTLILDIDPEIALTRIQCRNTYVPKTYYDNKTFVFYKSISESYKHSTKLYKSKTKVINANLSIEEVHKDIISSFNSEFNLNVKALSSNSIYKELYSDTK